MLSNVPMIIYFSLVHQRGTVAVTDLLRKVTLLGIIYVIDIIIVL